MTPRQRFASRVSLALGLSLLAHALLIFAPLIELPQSSVPLPPLTARLESIPKPVEPPRPLKKQTTTRSAASTSVGTAGTPTETAPPVPDTAPAPPDIPPEPEPQPAHPLPRRAQLTFSAFQGEGGLKLGESVHRLEIENGHYLLQTVTQTTGMASLFKAYQLTQASRGLADAHGLHPRQYAEEKRVSGSNQNLVADFDREAGRLRFSHGGETALPVEAQDILSILYQLSQLPLDQRVLPVYISNGKKLERYELEVGAEEIVESRLGKLRALPLRKIHGAGEEGLDIWLGLEYRLLPIKVRQIERNGKIAGEMVVSDIRVSPD